MTAALERSLEVLVCPHCGEALAHVDRSLRCRNGHDFNVSRQGYVAFTSGGGPHHQGDTPPMVAARDAFLRAGHYEPIVDAIVADVQGHGWSVELAGGTGYYLAGVLDRFPGLDGISIDVSKNAARTAARTHPRLASITGDVRAKLPIADGSIDVVLSVFGPRRGDEVARILAPGGRAIVVTPGPAHLRELRERFALLGIADDKQARLDAAMRPLSLGSRSALEYTVELSAPDVADAILMGPNAFHREVAEIESLASELVSPFRTTVAVTVSRFDR